MTYGQRLKELRLSKGVSLKVVAEEIGCDLSSVSYWENEIYEPKLTYIKKLAIFYDVSADYIIGLENDTGISKILS